MERWDGVACWGIAPVEMVFPVVKLLDYRERWEELEWSEDPFSVVVMAHLQSQRTCWKVQERLEWKLRLTRC